MPKTKINVELIKPLSLISIRENIESAYRAMRQCYFDGLCTKINLSDENEDLERAVLEVISSGHRSICEHIVFTFAIEGGDRSFSHQFVRHRIATYSQQSQRYCGLAPGDELSYVIPPVIESNPEALDIFLKHMTASKKAYDDILKCIGERKNEDARSVLPNATETKIVASFNINSLMHFFSLRCCNRAQWQIRAIANEMLRICKGVYPVLFENAGASCVQHGICPELPKFSCGKCPTIHDIAAKVKEGQF